MSLGYGAEKVHGEARDGRGPQSSQDGEFAGYVNFFAEVSLANEARIILSERLFTAQVRRIVRFFHNSFRRDVTAPALGAGLST